MLAVPLPVGPMLHLIDPSCLHGDPPMPCERRAGYRVFLATIGPGSGAFAKPVADLPPNSHA
jgi:hypothetical protein